ncbi:MAG: hypothetical protein HYY18_14445 [Planctomycetes bacterium]|nr:hypothetical protein [Planctomycetota bacterium]
MTTKSIATWANCCAGFDVDPQGKPTGSQSDGGLVDLIAPGTGPEEWEGFWAALRRGPFVLSAYRDGCPIPMPETAAWSLAETQTATMRVTVRTGTVSADCHFFGGDLEMSLDPREVSSEQAFQSLLALMRSIASAIRLPVLAAPENGGVARAFLRVRPNGQAESLQPG